MGSVISTGIVLVYMRKCIAVYSKVWSPILSWGYKLTKTMQLGELAHWH